MGASGRIGRDLELVGSDGFADSKRSIIRNWHLTSRSSIILLQ